MAQYKAPNFGTIPREIRHDILLSVILDETDRLEYPFGKRGIPFDRPLICIHSREGTEQWPTTDGTRMHIFWLTKTMEGLMLLNKQFYQEIYYILYSEFAVHFLDVYGRPKTNPRDWVSWMKLHHQQALSVIKYFHLRIELDPRAERMAGPQLVGQGIEGWTMEEMDGCMHLAENIPHLKSVTFQVAFLGRAHREQTMRLATADRLMRIFDACGPVAIGLALEPPKVTNRFHGYSFSDSEVMETVLEECRRRLGGRVLVQAKKELR